MKSLKSPGNNQIASQKEAERLVALLELERDCTGDFVFVGFHGFICAESWSEAWRSAGYTANPVLRQQVPTIVFNEPSAASFSVSVPRKTGLCFLSENDHVPRHQHH